MKKCMGCMSDYRDDMNVCPACGYSDAEARDEMYRFPDRLPVETILDGRYILGRLLSASDYSMIYNSWDALLQIQVAIREYYPSIFPGTRDDQGTIRLSEPKDQTLFDTGKKAFEAEAVRLNLSQVLPEAVNYYRLVRANGTSYIVMEYLNGESLQDYIEEKATIQLTEAMEIVGKIKKNLEGLHNSGILHLNLSPDNVYLDENGLVKLIDYGSAKAAFISQPGCDIHIYQPEFIAPEVLSGGKTSRESDLYSLGSICYYLVSGKRPTKGNLHSLKGIKERDAGYAKAIRILTDNDPGKRPEGLRLLG